MTSFEEAQSDHIHEVRWSNDSGELEPITTTVKFFDDIDRRCFADDDEPEEMLGISQMSSALGVILDFLCRPEHPAHIAGRALAPQQWLWPSESRYENVAHIARDLGITRAALSKSMLNFRDLLGVRLPVGKRAYTRDTY